MYTIANVIYGFNLPEEVVQASTEEETVVAQMVQSLENREDGFLQYYSGSADFPPSAFGVLLCQFNECQDVKVSTLILEAKEKHLKEFQQNFDKLPEEVKEYFGEKQPCVFILWATS